METWPEVIGLSLVLSTLLSMFLSHMSLIVHPAPLITKEPAAKVASRVRSGRWPGPAAMQMLWEKSVKYVTVCFNQTNKLTSNHKAKRVARCR